MSSEPNSVRLQRLTKTMDLPSVRSTSMMENNSDTVKLPALRAINKGIKYNDLSFATSRDLSKLRKEPDQIDNIEEVSAHHSLVVIRKKYDNMSKNRQQMQRQVDKLQSEYDKLTNDKNNFESSKHGGKDKVVQLDTSLKSMKLQLEEADIQRKIMQSMIGRLKKDKVVYDLRKYNMEKDLQKTKKFKKLIQQEHTKHSESDDKTQKMKSKLIAHVSNEKQERDFHLSKVEGMLESKVGMVENEEYRNEEMKEIALATLQDKDIRQKNWYKVYLCHRFVQKLLRDKMHREMMKFNVVEVAFKNIKTSTGVSESETFIKKFLNKENTYGDLLGKIAENQRIMTSVKLEGEELRKEKNQLQAEQESLNQTKVGTQDLSKQQKQFTQISDKGLICEAFQQKMNSWLIRNFKKFDVPKEQNEGENENEKEQEEVTNQALNANFKKYIENLHKNLEELAESQVDSQQTDVSLGGKNCRIKFNPEDAVEPQDRKYNEQDDFIDGQRGSILKNNEKFMKELKKKYEEIKKALIEAEPKKKEAPIERPKQPAPPPVEA